MKEKEQEGFSPRKLLVYMVEVILVALLALTAVALVQMYWIAPNGVYGPSMEDTLYSGDTVYINKAFKSISRGDVVIVYLPDDYNNYGLDWGNYTGENDDTDRCPSSRKKTFDDFFASLPFFRMSSTDDKTGTTKDGYKMVIKRVIGCPGDTVQIIDGVLYVNGERDSRAGLHNYAVEYHHVLLEGEYFILGDNRAVSKDSSSYGPIRGSWIYGKVFAAHTQGKWKKDI